MAGAVIAPVLNLIREGFGVEPTAAGLIITTHALFIALFSPVIGVFIDKVGAKKPLMISLVLYGFGGGSGVFISSFWGLIISRAFLGIGVACILTSITGIILSLYQGEERNKVMGWRGSAISFGGIIWPLIGGALGTISCHLPFAVYFLGIPFGILVLVAIPQTQKGEIQGGGSKGAVLAVFKDNPIIYVIYGYMRHTMPDIPNPNEKVNIMLH